MEKKLIVVEAKEVWADCVILKDMFNGMFSISKNDYQLLSDITAAKDAEIAQLKGHILELDKQNIEYHDEIGLLDKKIIELQNEIEFRNWLGVNEWITYGEKAMQLRHIPTNDEHWVFDEEASITDLRKEYEQSKK